MLRRWRRKRLEESPVPRAWLKILHKRVRYFRLLKPQERTRLLRLIQFFLADIRFEGCGGLEVDDEIRVTIAAQACLLLLNRAQDSFPGLQTILVYPGSYFAPTEVMDEAGVIHAGDEQRLGEASHRGAIVLSWDDVRRDGREISDGFNVTLHEFAHQLDQEDGGFDGAPRLDRTAHYRSWSRTLRREYDALRRAARRGEAGVIDHYGATDPAEFFAVVTEAFFELPIALRAEHPQLYAELRKFFRQDPARRFRSSRASSARLR